MGAVVSSRYHLVFSAEQCVNVIMKIAGHTLLTSEMWKKSLLLKCLLTLTCTGFVDYSICALVHWHDLLRSWRTVVPSGSSIWKAYLIEGTDKETTFNYIKKAVRSHYYNHQPVKGLKMHHCPRWVKVIWPSRLDPKGVSACLMLLWGSGVSATSNRNQIDHPPFSCSVISSMALPCPECEPNVISQNLMTYGQRQLRWCSLSLWFVHARV